MKNKRKETVMSNEYSWTEMITAFRALGGVADNVVQRQGRYGNGLFPVDPAQPVRIHVPDRLLIDVVYVDQQAGQLVIKAEAPVDSEVRDFFARYQRHYSWGADGRKTAEALESGLKAWPQALLERLAALKLVDLSIRHQGDWDAIVQRSFLQSRRINYCDKKVLMPVLELVNHSSVHTGFNIEVGIGIEGTFEDEVLVNYHPLTDPLHRFLSYGFASPEIVAFSLPLGVPLSASEQVVVGNKVAASRKVGPLPVPETQYRDGKHFLTHVRLGTQGAPRIPKTLFRAALGTVAKELADEAFDRIRNANIVALLELMALAEEDDSPLGKAFRAALRYQLQALSHCYGVREDLLTANA